MLSLCYDTLSHIAEYLSNRDKIRLSAVCRITDVLKYKFIYHDKVLLETIKNFAHKSNFKYVFYETDDTNISEIVTHLKIQSNFRGPIMIPQSVTHLTFGTQFDNPIGKQLSSTTLTHLVFNDYFDQSVDNLPESLTHLVFGGEFISPNVLTVNGFFNWKDIYAGGSFDRSIDNLPKTLMFLSLGCDFNTPIKNLPSSLTYLNLGNEFNQSIKNILPPTLIYLILGDEFRRSIKNRIPQSVIHLSISFTSSRPIYVPPWIKHLEIDAKEGNWKENCLPYGIIHLKIYGNVNTNWTIKYRQVLLI
uniref:F-box domain-containing protein n=1 Tax=viral metagenome TaxID=1070528 RepID=A0A6C0C5Z2_9ZZZZ